MDKDFGVIIGYFVEFLICRSVRLHERLKMSFSDIFPQNGPYVFDIYVFWLLMVLAIILANFFRILNPSQKFFSLEARDLAYIGRRLYISDVPATILKLTGCSSKNGAFCHNLQSRNSEFFLLRKRCFCPQ